MANIESGRRRSLGVEGGWISLIYEFIISHFSKYQDTENAPTHLIVLAPGCSKTLHCLCVVARRRVL